MSKTDMERNEVDNGQLIRYCAPFLEYFRKRFRKDGRFVRIDIHTRNSGHVIVSVYAVDDNSRQGIGIYEGNEYVDDPMDKVSISGSSWYTVKKDVPENWTDDAARTDLEEAIATMDKLGGDE